MDTEVMLKEIEHGRQVRLPRIKNEWVGERLGTLAGQYATYVLESKIFLAYIWRVAYNFILWMQVNEPYKLFT